jgi:FixJ family two-component response regulator
MGRRRRRPVVCIVDDDASLCRALTTLLAAHGVHAEVYTCPEPFLAKLRAGRLSCAAVLLDIHLGTTSGFDVYDCMTASKNAIPTIFMTGRDDAVSRARAADLGATAYLVKPFEDTVLMRAIEQALGSATKGRSS